MPTPQRDAKNGVDCLASDRLNVLDGHVRSGPEVGTTQDCKGDNEPDCEPRSGQGKRRSATHKRSRRGPERGPRSLGRYPFLVELKVYLRDVRHAYSDSTYREMERKLPYIHQVFQELKSEGFMATTNPRKIGQEEVSAFVGWMKAEDGLRPEALAPGTQKKYIQYLGNFLAYVDNGIIERMVRKKQLTLPKAPSAPQESFTEGELAAIMMSLEGASSGSLDVLGVFGHVVFCGYAGTRLKEIRLAEKADHSSHSRELTIRHPKGEGSWGETRIVRISGPGLRFVTDYLTLREEELRRRGIQDRGNLPLVPRIVGSNAGQWPDSVLHNVKCEVERNLGLCFTFRKLRRTYGQNLLDVGVSMESVSKAMGHASVATTQRHYVRIKTARAFDEIDRAYAAASANSIPVDCETARWCK